MARRRRRRNQDPAVLARIRDLAETGASAKDIEVSIGQDRDLADRRLPSLRTIQEIVQELSGTDPTEAWSLADAEPGDPLTRVLLDIKADVISRTRGRAKDITRGEASWVGRLLDAAPSLPPQVLHRMAQAYLRAQERSEPVSELDAILALAPWSSPAHQERYLQAIDESWLDEDPLRSLWLAAFLLGPAAIPRQIAYGPWDSLDDEARQLRLLAADVQRRFDDAMARREQEAEQTREGEGATDDAQG